MQDAEAYREQAVAEAKGETSRFLQIYEQYKKAPAVTRERMYLETMERILGDTNKIIIDTGRGGQGVVPYLPLTELPVPPARSSSGGSSSSSSGAPRSGSSSTGGAQ
jgi:modulator of FtsH protease HflK